MKYKPKGRKIYKTKEKNYYGKSPMGKFLSGALTVLLIGGIGFLGYSAAEPIINYTKHKGDEPDITEETQTDAVQETAPEATEEPTVQETTDAENSHDFTAAALSADDMTTLEKLRGALEAIPQNAEIEYIEVPLKARGGAVCYDSDIKDINEIEAEMSKLTLAEITKEISRNGYKPAALVSVFRDSIYPQNFKESGYVKSENGEQWKDSSGKPWLTPYSQKALDYTNSIIDEISPEGFEEIILTDMVFPNFTQADFDILDPVLAQNDRCISMTSAANMFYDKVSSHEASMKIEVSAEDIIRGKTDVLRPMLLSCNQVVLCIDLDVLDKGISSGETVYEFREKPEKNVEKCLEMVEAALADFNVTIRIKGDSYDYDKLFAAGRTLSEKGYDEYIIG